MRTVIIALYKAFPPECGAATVTFDLFRHLEGEKALLQLNRKNGFTKFDNNSIIKSIGPLPSNKALKGMWIILKLPAILKALVAFKPDNIILEGAAWSLYNLGIFWAARIRRIQSRLVYHAHNVEYLLRKEKNSYLIARISHWAEGNLIKRCTSFAVSDVDANQFRALYGVKPKILANGVDPGRFSKLKKDDIYAVERQYNLTHPFMLFMGLIGYKPNDEAVSFLIEKILPRLINKKSDIKLVIIGGKVPYLESWLINPGIVPYEMVPALIQASDLCLAPIFSGSGTRLKILEYLAAGKPVVTTSKGAEGLDVLNGRDLVISDNEVAFEETILNLINDMDLSKRMGFQGRRTVAKKYSWQAIVRDFIVDVGLRAD